MERKNRKWDRGGGEEISLTYSLYVMADVLLSLVSLLLLLLLLFLSLLLFLLLVR